MSRTARGVWALAALTLLPLACGREFTASSTADAGFEAGAVDGPGAGGRRAGAGGAGTAGRAGGSGAGTGGEGGQQGGGGAAGHAGEGGAKDAGSGGMPGAGGAPEAGSDAPPPLDAAPAEGGPTEAATDPCEPAPPVLAGAVLAHCSIDSPPFVDGRLDDWPSSWFTDGVTHATGEILGTWSATAAANDANLSSKFAARWDRDALYVAAQVRDDVRRTPDTGRYYQNDALELFFDGGNDAAEYGDDDIQVLVDAAGRSQAFHFPNLNPFAVPPGVTAAVSNAAGGANWNVEVRVPWSVLGSLSRVVGEVIGFDTALDDNDSGVRDRGLVWRNLSPVGCNCAQAPNPYPCEPYCHTKTFAKLQLGGL